MNKLFKHILNIFILWLLLIPSISSADFIEIWTQENWVSAWQVWTFNKYAYNNSLYCIFIPTSNTSCTVTELNYTFSRNYWWLFCFKNEWNSRFLTVSCTNNTNTTQTFRFFAYNANSLDTISKTCPTCPTINQDYCVSNNLCPSCPSCPNQYTSLECQTEYNLIPIENVTKNYCEINFDLIDPATCPITEWSWAVNWSSLFINGTQYAWNNSINMFIPNYLWRNITFNDEETNVEIEWYNVDEEYLNNIIDNEKLQPTNKDFENMLVWIVNFAPYIFICLIIYYLLSRLPKMFR